MRERIGFASSREPRQSLILLYAKIRRWKGARDVRAESTPQTRERAAGEALGLGLSWLVLLHVSLCMACLGAGGTEMKVEAVDGSAQYQFCSLQRSSFEREAKSGPHSLLFEVC